jgi:hypothetical protein
MGRTLVLKASSAPVANSGQAIPINQDKKTAVGRMVISHVVGMVWLSIRISLFAFFSIARVDSGKIERAIGEAVRTLLE